MNRNSIYGLMLKYRPTIKEYDWLDSITYDTFIGMVFTNRRKSQENDLRLSSFGDNELARIFTTTRVEIPESSAHAITPLILLRMSKNMVYPWYISLGKSKFIKLYGEDDSMLMSIAGGDIEKFMEMKS